MIAVAYRFVIEDHDRHGNVRVYFRRKGQRKIRIRETPGTEAFERRYRELLAGCQPEVQTGPKPPLPRTWRWLCVQYIASPTFKGLDPMTQRQRRSVLEMTFKEPIHPDAEETFGDFPLSRMTPKAIRVLRDRKLPLKAAANQRIKVIKAVFNWAQAEEPPLAETNPAREVPRIRIPGAGIHTWTPDEVRRFEKRHPIGSTPRLALAIFLFTGLRLSDAARLGRQHARDGWFKIRQFKGRNHSPIDIELPILPELKDIIAKSKTGDMTYLVTTRGKPFSVAGLGIRMRQWCDQAKLSGCSAHGLRKAGATIAAENGATAHQLMSIFGWLSLKEAERYTKAAERKRLAANAIHLLKRDKS